MKRVIFGVALLFLGLAAVGCGRAPKVVQGKVVSFDAAGHTLVVRDEIAPNADMIVSVEKAEIGAEPVPDDTVRVAYYEESGRNRATRVMNLTRQKDFGGSKH